MIFLDTCVWIELLGVRTPVQAHEILQAKAASELMERKLGQDESIVTCKEQLIELVTAIEKVMMRSVNRERKEKNLQGVGNIKEFRKLTEFQETKQLCKMVIDDVSHFAEISHIGIYNIEDIIQRLDLADINDCLYYDYCMKEKIDFYTFDWELGQLGMNNYLHRFNADENKWV